MSVISFRDFYQTNIGYSVFRKQLKEDFKKSLVTGMTTFGIILVVLGGFIILLGGVIDFIL